METPPRDPRLNSEPIIIDSDDEDDIQQPQR